MNAFYFQLSVNNLSTFNITTNFSKLVPLEDTFERKTFFKAKMYSPPPPLVIPQHVHLSDIIYLPILIVFRQNG